MNITYENLQHLRDLTFVDYYIDENRDTLLASFLKGCIFSDKELATYTSQYLWQYFGIDHVKNTWLQQVDHYAFEQGLNWERGFIHLIASIIENAHISYDISGEIISRTPELENKPLYIYKGVEEPVTEDIDNSCKSIQLKNGSTLNVGDVIQLSDKIGEDYKKTKFYDKSLRNPSWELFYPSEKDFEYTSFYYEGNENTKPFNFGSVRRLFSNSTSIIKYISIQYEVIFVYTNLFKVEIEKALEMQEVKILDKNKELVNITDFSNFITEIRNNQYKHSSMLKMLELIDHWCFDSFSSLKKEWQKNHVSISYLWFENK